MLYNDGSIYINVIFVLYIECNQIMYSANIKSVL